MDAAPDPAANLVFGRFEVLPHRRELLADGKPLRLGGRAFDVLLALIEARGAVVTRDALLARVWPDRAVEQNALLVQISALRAALGADRNLIRTVSRHGYQFAGEILVGPAGLDQDGGDRAPRSEATLLPSNVPALVSDLIGRDQEMGEILRLATGHRLVTLTGAGGIGKTRLALAAARRLLPQFADGVWLADLAPLADPGLVPATVRRGRPARTRRWCRHRRTCRRCADREAALLLVLDNCEHVIDAAATMAEASARANPAVSVIATSREPLRAEGERLYPVPPLARAGRGCAGERSDAIWRRSPVRGTGARRGAASRAGPGPDVT